jgi:hypothetical protein
MKALKKILIVLVIGALIAGAFMPMGSVAQLSTAPAIQVDMVWMDGPTNVTGEYANATHIVLVKVTNTGTEYLSDIDVNCEIYSDASASTLVLDLGLNQTASLDIGETMVFEFWDWTPNVVDEMIDNYFWINATATGMGFMDIDDTDNILQPVTIRNVTNVAWAPHMMFDTMGIIMTPYPYVEEMMPGVETYNYSSAANQPQYNLLNLGNVDATVTVDISGYDLGSGTPEVAVHTDTDTPTIAPGASGWIDYPGGTWDLSALAGDGLINVSVSGADYVAANTTHEFMVADYTDVKTMENSLTTDLLMKFYPDNPPSNPPPGGYIFNTTAQHTFMVDVVNNGNQDITTDFQANLTAADWTGGTTFGTVIEYGYQLVDAGTTTLRPGDISPEAWAVTPPGGGFYQFNASAPLVETFGDFNATNNVTELLLNFEDTEGHDMSITSPMTGKYPVMSIDINATVTNIETLDFADIGGCNVSLEIFDTNMTTDTSDDMSVWAPADVVINGLEMTMDTWADWTWTGAEGGMEYMIVVNASTTNNFVEKTETIIFPHPNGTVSGTITPNMADIVVSAYDGPTMIASTMTDATGYYMMSLEAIVGMYNITVTAPYGYNNAWNETVMVLDDGRTTLVDFVLTEPPKGMINGTITLMEEGMPDDNLDYTDITVAVDGTPLSVMADMDGNYTITGILPGIVNVTASKTGFTTAWNDTVDVVALMTTMYVNLTLYEDWGVMVDPAHGDIDVAVDAMVTVTFEEEINTSVNLTNNFDVEDSTDVSVTGSIEWVPGNMSFVFTPDANLSNGETYTVWIDTGFMNTMDTMVLHRMWESEFTTEIGIVTGWIEGEVTDAWSGDPIEGATVSAAGESAVTDATGMYSLEVTAGSHDTTASMSLYTDSTITGVTVNLGETTIDVNFTLEPEVNIDAKVTLQDDTVATLDPEGTSQEDVSADTEIMLEFEEAINATSLDFFTVVEDSTGTEVAGNSSWNATSNTVTFTPTTALNGGENYTLTVMDTVMNATDAAILPRDIEWMFMVFEVTETVTATITPADTTTGVELDAEVKIVFSHAMNETVTEAAITAAFGTDFTWAADGLSVVISHANFSYSTPYTVSVSDAGLSLGGLATAAATSTFTTMAAPTFDYPLGAVLDKDNNPVANANVVVKDANGDTVWTGQTDADGEISWSETTALPEGDYTVTVSKADYEDVEFTFSVDANGDLVGTPTIPTMKASDGDGGEDEFDWLPVILIIVVIIIIVILLALAMKPKKAAEEELEEEEGEEEEGAEEEEFECPECGAAVSSGEAVCPECGAEFEEEEFECPECGAQLEAGAGTCSECGAEFEAEEAAEEGEEMEEGEDEELEDYEIEEEEFEEEEMEEGEEMEEEEMEEEEMEEAEEGEEEELPDEEEELPDEEEAEEAEEVSEEEEEKLD